MWKKIRFLLSFCLLVISLTLLVWSFVPAKKRMVVQLLQPTVMSVKSNGDEDTAILENRQVRLEWPSSLRIGDEGVIQLDFEVTQEDVSSLNQQSGLVDAYTNHNVMAEANFEVAGMQITPANTTRVSMPPGQPVKIIWQITPEQDGSYLGIVWLSLRFLPLDGNPPIHLPIYVKDIKVQVSSFLGLNGSLARLFGGIGMLVSLLFVFEYAINAVIKRKKKKTNLLTSFAGQANDITRAEDL
ncbi:MAG: hypothetical protein A2Y88_09885 [Chloroflexi bacterium RBG_13_48_10]|nr:MAG: hypothetical protein A2Y88_09885 [Chloroflexi bacterium RBG_13_48_10]